MKSYRFGKLPPKADYRTLAFKKYVKSTLPAPPKSVDILSKVYNNTGINDPATLFPMDGNDTTGDCTIAASSHAITVYNALINKKKIWDSKEVVKLYFHLTNGIDSGCYELDVLNYWQSTGIDLEKILAYTSIDVKNLVHIQQAIQIFGGVYIGFQVQENCIEEFDAGKPWTPGTLTNNGHAVYVVGYDTDGVTILTWGNIQKGTWAWWNECVDEAYAIIPPEASDQKFAGIDITQLKLDLNEVAN